MPYQASTPVRPSPLSPFESANSRQSPFRRQNSVSPATVRATTPIATPTRQPSSLSPTKHASLSPEKASPFVRRPSQINQTPGRPSSPFARPTSSLSISTSPIRKPNDNPKPDEDPFRGPAFAQSKQPNVATVEDEEDETNLPAPASPSRFGHDGAFPSTTVPSPITTPNFPSQANLRPVAARPSPGPAAIKPPVFHPPQPQTLLPSLIANRGINGTSIGAGSGVGGGSSIRNSKNNGTYTHLPPALLHSMRESFEVLDAANAGNVDAAAVADMLRQLNLASDPAALAAFFPPHPAGAPSQLNLARYLDVLSGPLAELAAPDELKAAFEAFDLDDSGQIDVSVLRAALLRPSDEGVVLSEREVDAVLGDFSGRRAFGSGNGLGKGEVFRYRDFMASVSAGGNGFGTEEGPGMVA